MSRAKKPLAMQKGNLTVEQQVEKQQAEEMITVGREQLARAPNWLIDSVAKKEFKRIVKEFEKVAIVGNLDLNNIGGYCNSYSSYVKATKELQGAELTIEKCMPNGSYTTAANPLIKIQKDYAEEMRKFANLCGLTIDSRLKMATTKTTKNNVDIENEFGDI